MQIKYQRFTTVASAFVAGVFLAPATAMAAPAMVAADGSLLAIFAFAAIVAVGLIARLAWRGMKAAEEGTKTTTASAAISAVPSRLTAQAGAIAEEADYAKYLVEVRNGPTASASAKSAAAAAPKDAAPKTDPLKEFFAWAPDHVVAMQRLVAKTCKASNAQEQHEKLTQVSEQLATFKSRAGLPELRPAWGLAVTLEGLLKQLTRRANTATPSTLRTLENATALLADLCVPGVRTDLALNPPIKILAVEDDPVNRAAVVMAVKKSFEQPDLAENGEIALAKANEQRYDLITLDVMMPGLDGFEVCSRIRKTNLNGSTPVLFITALKDFESRARLLTTGGNEVMGKPFLTFEITVKALTLVLRARLQGCTQVLGNMGGVPTHATPAVDWPSPNAKPAAEEPAAASTLSLPTEAAPGQKGAPMALLAPPVFDTEESTALANPQAGSRKGRQISRKFLDYMPICVAEMKQRVATLGGADDAAARKELTLRLHMRLQCLSKLLDVPELRPACEMSRSLEGFFKKLAEGPRHLTDATLRSITEGLDLLQKLCVPGIRTDLASKPPIRVLVVDDEPIARRALTGALQMGFPRPVCVETGEAAVEQAQEHEFDLVFMDVVMPGMDGFSACQKIHQTEINRTTPVMFVTSHSDVEFQARARESGSTDYVSKPFIFVEISLKALTIALRNRLARNQAAPVETAPKPA